MIASGLVERECPCSPPTGADSHGFRNEAMGTRASAIDSGTTVSQVVLRQVPGSHDRHPSSWLWSRGPLI